VLVSSALPFGRPEVTDSTMVRMIVKKGYPPMNTVVNRVPGWRPTWSIQSKNELAFCVEERVDAVQYGTDKLKDMVVVNGAVNASIDVENVPEVSVFISCDDGSVSNITLHSCTQRGTEILGSSGLSVRFIPPPCPFMLGTYSVEAKTMLPIRGFLQMTEESDKRVKLLLQLKLQDGVSNSFEQFDAVLPFFNRGVISSAHTHTSVSQGEVVVGPDRASLIWSLGPKITNARMEAMLSCTVSFEATYGAVAAALERDKDPYCTGTTSYAMLRFKINNWSPSSCHVDQRKVSVNPAPKSRPTITFSRSCVSGDYKIWNCKSKARHCVPIEFEPSFS